MSPVEFRGKAFHCPLLFSKTIKGRSVREAFKDTSIKNEQYKGRNTLGDGGWATIGSREYLDDHVSKKVTNWINDIA